MRRLLILFVIFLLFNWSIASYSKKAIRKQIAKSLLKIKEIQESRKLQEAEGTESADNDEEMPVGPPSTSNKHATIQFVNFNNYHTSLRTFLFNVIFFLNRAVPKTIGIPLKVKYNRRLRSLEEEVVTINSTCDKIGEGTYNAEGGITQSYNCTAPKDDSSEFLQLAVDKDAPLSLTLEDGTEEIASSGDINYASPEAANASLNIQTNERVINKAVLLQGGSLEDNTPKEEGYFKIKGGLTEFKKGDEVTMKFNNTLGGNSEDVEIKCEVENVDANNISSLYCETGQKNLTFNVDGATGLHDTTLLTLNMTDPNAQVNKLTPYNTNGTNNHINYRKNSSGLSGGAIAGIVIACAVVLIAASIVAMMLRKPAPPLDNTTVVGLKTVDNY